MIKYLHGVSNEMLYTEQSLLIKPASDHVHDSQARSRSDSPLSIQVSLDQTTVPKSAF